MHYEVKYYTVGFSIRGCSPDRAEDNTIRVGCISEGIDQSEVSSQKVGCQWIAVSLEQAISCVCVCVSVIVCHVSVCLCVPIYICCLCWLVHLSTLVLTAGCPSTRQVHLTPPIRFLARVYHQACQWLNGPSRRVPHPRASLKVQTRTAPHPPSNSTEGDVPRPSSGTKCRKLGNLAIPVCGCLAS